MDFYLGGMPISQRIGFDARLIGALGIGRYISGLLPPLGQILADRLVVIGHARDAALIRALVGPRPAFTAANAAPYRLAEQITMLARLASMRLALAHFPHYNLPLAYPGRFAVTIHDLFSFEFPEIHSGPVPRWINRALVSGAVSRATAVIAPSHATASAVGKRFPRAAARITVIPEAADSRFTRTPPDDTWQRYYGVRMPYFLYLGQWKAYKNVPLLIDAFRQVVARRPECQLVIVGQDARHPEVPAAAARLPSGSVVFPGRVPDAAVPPLYRQASAVVVPSLAEGFGLPVLEAMASGVPVVCSDIPVLHEVANGVAIFCDASDASAFARGMLDALAMDDPRLDLGIARAHTFSWQAAAEKTVAVYERALATSR